MRGTLLLRGRTGRASGQQRCRAQPAPSGNQPPQGQRRHPLGAGHREQYDAGIHHRHLTRPRSKSYRRLPSDAHFPPSLNCYTIICAKTQKRMAGKTQETAAAKAGMSVRSARKWQSGPLPSQAKPEHRWRTRPDPFDGVWEDEIETLLRNDPTGKLKATTIIDCPSTSSGGRAASRAVQRIPAADAACCLIQKCYRNFSTWGPPQSALIPALQGAPPWAHQPWRRPAFWP